MATNDEGLVNLDSNAIRLIFNVTWAASFLSPTFWSKKEVWMKPPLPSCRLLRFVSLSLELLRYLETEFSKAYVGWKDFFPSWKTHGYGRFGGETRQLSATLCIIMRLQSPIQFRWKGTFLQHVVTPRIYLLHTSRLSTLYLTRGVICYIRSEEFYHRIHHQEFLRKVCYQGILKCAAHFRGNSPAKRRYIFVMTKRICKFSLPWDFDWD